MQTASPSTGTAFQANAPAPDARIVALDGFRGLMTLFVLGSHYFAEVKHGVTGLAVGWLAVVSFFVLSGFLVGRLILERQECANFFVVFYARRFCRTLPVYLVCVIFVFAGTLVFHNPAWLNVYSDVPLWSYLTFTQGFFFVANGHFGSHWVAPTWTLAVEEHFYLLVPALFFVAPRRHLLLALTAGMALPVAFRAVVLVTGILPDMVVTVMLPGNADALFCGLIAAALIKSPNIDWRRYDLTLRLIPVAMLLATNLLMRLVRWESRVLDPRRLGFGRHIGGAFVDVPDALGSG